MTTLIQKLKPKFWDHHDDTAGSFNRMFNYRFVWKISVFLMIAVALVPLIFITVVDYQATRNAVRSEILYRTSRLVSNTRRTLYFFLDERRAVLSFIVKDNSYDNLNNEARLSELLNNLQNEFTGFIDLGVIDANGRQSAYVGPYPLEGADYSDQDWFKEVMERGYYISDIFMGFRRIPHLAIAFKHDLPNGDFFVLRATLDNERFEDMLSNLLISGEGDAFLINHEGILQTQSRFYGHALEELKLPIPPFSEKTQVIETSDEDGDRVILGYAYIARTPYILMIVKQTDELMKQWYKTRFQLIGFLMVSTTSIIIVALGIVTFMVGKIDQADQRRFAAMHRVEYENKMASIGRMAASIAHEVNNPLAIINEKAGLIKDLFTFREEYNQDPKLIGSVDSILKSVKRCGAITKRLLKFARNMDEVIGPVNLVLVVREILGFLEKEADYRSIQITVNADEGIPEFETDRGKVQQILLNIINNAFAAVDDGGHIEVAIKRRNKESIMVSVIDDGCGIPAANIRQIFEPFFTTKSKIGGTGLGLSITYGLVQEIGGTIDVESEPGKGTRFTLTLPLTYHKTPDHRENPNECIVGG
ncbi:MAG: sensor histidine kinase [Thermodesulfobacteriota bacterium]